MSKTENSLNRAIALQYDGKSAPIVSAKGAGHIAEEIIELAKQHDIPVQERPDLVDFLSRVELGEEIPEILYVAVAEVIAFAYMIKNKKPDFLQKEQ